jgi:hypothetical protein
MHQIMIKVIKDRSLWQVVGFTTFLKIFVIAIAFAILGSPNTEWMGHLIGDMWYWVGFWQKTQGLWTEALGRKLIPYVDFDYVYPPLSGILYWMIGGLIDLTEGKWKGILVSHALVMAIADVINAGLIYIILREINPKRALLLTYVFVLSLTELVLTPVRYESYVVTFVLIGYLFHRHDKPMWANLFWSAGCWLKWYPFFFIVAEEIRVFVVNKKRDRWWKALGIFVAIAALFNVPFMLGCIYKNGNLVNWWTTYSFHLNRSTSWDTLFGVVKLWFGNIQLEGFANNITVLLIALAIILRLDLKVEYKGVLVIAAALLCNRIYSPQFNLWFYPFLLFVIAQETKRRWLIFLSIYIAIDLLTVLVFPFSFADAIREMNGFGDSFAAKSGGFWTIIFSLGIVIRAVLLAILYGLILISSPHQGEKFEQLDLDLEVS